MNKKYSKIENKLSNNTEREISAEYHTDYEELAHETVWIRAAIRRRKWIFHSHRSNIKLSETRNKDIKNTGTSGHYNRKRLKGLHASIKQCANTQIQTFMTKILKLMSGRRDTTTERSRKHYTAFL